MTTQHVRHAAALTYLEHPIKMRPSSGYGTVYQQAEDIGGTFTRIRWGLPDQSIANFSPCLVSEKGHRLLAFRSQPEPFVFRHDQKYFYYNNTPTEVYVGELVSDDTILGARKIRTAPHRLSYEDPRLFKSPCRTKPRSRKTRKKLVFLHRQRRTKTSLFNHSPNNQNTR